MRRAKRVGEPAVIIVGRGALLVIQNLAERRSRLCWQLSVEYAQVRLIEKEVPVDHADLLRCRLNYSVCSGVLHV
jgi:hypothetical protein